MREILFRGKRRDTGEWTYGSLLKPIFGAKPAILQDASVDDSCRLDFEYHFIDPDTVGQYAGIPDKNGKKIFDGDIFLVQGMEAWVNGLYIVEFSEANHCWWLRNPNPYGRSFSFSDLNGFHLDGIVVGNIHDNPELLEG